MFFANLTRLLGETNTLLKSTFVDFVDNTEVIDFHGFSITSLISWNFQVTQ